MKKNRMDAAARRKGLEIRPVERPDRLASYWLAEGRSVICIVLSGIGCNAFMAVVPLLQGRLIDALLKRAPLSALLQEAALFVGAVLMIQLVRYVKRFYVRRFANSTSASLRLTIYNNVIRRDVHTLETEQAGDLMTRAVAEVELCTEGMRKCTTEVFDTGVLLCAYFAAMLTYDVKITLLGCLFVPVAMLLARGLKKAVSRLTADYREEAGRAANLTYETVSNAVLFRVTGLEKQRCAAYAAGQAVLRRKAERANVMANAMQPIYNVIALMGIVAVIDLGARQAIAGRWSVGTFSAYLTMFTALTTKVSKAGKMFNAAQKAKISWLRLKPYLGPYRPMEALPEKSCAGVSLEVENLAFSYPKAAEKAVEGITFTAVAGQVIGVTGPVACGKTALGLALSGLFGYEGSIRLCGRELSTCLPQEKSRLISWLGHDPQLLSATIEENIAMGEKVDVLRALRMVCFEEDLQTMPDGIDTQVGSEGMQLSGGQRARLALARTLGRGAKLVILDDPFASVDLKTEAEILRRIRAQLNDAVIVLLSHRLNAFPLTDQVVMMEDAHTACCAPHEKLMERSPLYRKIFELQKAQAEEAL